MDILIYQLIKILLNIIKVILNLYSLYFWNIFNLIVEILNAELLKGEKEDSE